VQHFFNAILLAFGTTSPSWTHIDASPPLRNARQLVEVVTGSLDTRADIATTEFLANYYLDRGQYSEAARCFERQIQCAGPDNLASVALLKAAIAFRATGGREMLRIAWKALEKKLGKEGLKIGKKSLSLEELKKEVEKPR
jgi:hypothetical protein